MKTKLSNLLLLLQAAAAVCTMGAIKLWAPTCSGLLELANGNQTPMKCHYAGQAALGIAVIILAAAVIGLLQKKGGHKGLMAVNAVAVDEPVKIGRLIRPEAGEHFLLVKIVDAREKGQKQIGFFREIVIKGAAGYSEAGADAPYGQVFVAHLIDHRVDLFQQFLAAGILFDRCPHGARPPFLAQTRIPVFTGKP